MRVGSDFFARRGALDSTAAPPRGVVDRVTDLAHPGIAIARIHPEVVAFFERTTELELYVTSHWRFPLSFLWPVVRPFFRLIGQFVLPRRTAQIETAALALDRALDGRGDARAIVRRYADGGPFQTVAYATFEREGSRLMSAAFPMPMGQIAGFLRLDPLAEDEQGRLAVVLTSAAQGDDAGIWFVLGDPSGRHFALRAPMSERLELWPVGMAGAPEVGLPGATIAGRHEQRFFGLRFVTHVYAMRPRPAGGA